MSKNKNSNKMSGAPRSKEARQKLRRWTFAAQMKMENGEIRGFNMPGLTYGNSHEAQLTAADLLAKFKSGESAPENVEIVPIGHETVSMATKRQLEGLNDQSNLATKAAFVLAEKYRLSTSSDKTVVEIVTSAFDEARDHLFPRLKEAKAKIEAMEVEVDKPKRKLGIDAVNEILASPPDPNL